MLTHQQKLYAEGRSDGMGKKSAAIAAGCPERTASQAASRYERDEKVKAHMLRLGFDPDAKPAAKKAKPAAKPKAVKPKTAPKPKAAPKPRAAAKPKPPVTPKPTAVEIAAERIAERALEVSDKVFTCPLEYMLHVMNEVQEDPKLRLDASKALASYTVAKPGEKGKKEERQDAADKVATTGRFSSAPAPFTVVK